MGGRAHVRLVRTQPSPRQRLRGLDRERRSLGSHRQRAPSLPSPGKGLISREKRPIRVYESDSEEPSAARRLEGGGGLLWRRAVPHRLLAGSVISSPCTPGDWS